MPTDRDLHRLAARLGRKLLRTGARVATAESCTGGWIARCITDIAGSSEWFDSAYVTYSNVAKSRDLKVPKRVLARAGAVSAATVHAMARGALRRTRVDMTVAVSGIAGPGGAVPGKPVGTVWFAIAYRRRRTVATRAYCKRFRGDRERVRRQSVAFALRLLLAAPLIQ